MKNLINHSQILAYTLYILMFWHCQNPGSVAPATNSRLAPLNPEPADYNYGFGTTVDIPLDPSAVCIIKHRLLPCWNLRPFFFPFRNVLHVLLRVLIVGYLIMICFNIRIWKRRKRNSKPRRLNWENGNRYTMGFHRLFQYTLVLRVLLVDVFWGWNTLLFYVVFGFLSLFFSPPYLVHDIILIPFYIKLFYPEKLVLTVEYIHFDRFTIYKFLEKYFQFGNN